MKCQKFHLAYCTNIHPAETWDETFAVLNEHTLKVRDGLIKSGVLNSSELYAIGLRLSAIAATQLREGDNLANFKQWLIEKNCYIFTINGFPYGQFHETRVKENVYKPDWTEQSRLDYTNNLFEIIAELAPLESGGSVSTLPGSFKSFQANEETIFSNLYKCSQHIKTLAEKTGKDLHLGLEPEPLGHFENTIETLEFFKKFKQWAQSNQLSIENITKYIGVNYDTCHFALEFDDCEDSLNAFSNAGIRISKIHLSNAIELSPSSKDAIEALKVFNEPTYLHQFMLKKASNNEVIKFADLPDFFKSNQVIEEDDMARVHFHIPLFHQPAHPLRSTESHAIEALDLLKRNQVQCPHVEIETYTWGVLPTEMQRPLVEQIIEEYHWTTSHCL